MRKIFTNFLVCLALVVAGTLQVMAQTQLSGTITDATTKDGLVGVSVQVKGKVIGTISDAKGKFSLTTNTPTPFKLIVSSVGFETQEIEITGKQNTLNIAMKEQVLLGQEVVVAASRVEENVMKSPVTVEKLDLRAIQNAAAPSVYEALGNLKGLDLATQSVLFKSINMRGFAQTGNVRVVQLIDGMDNSAPGLNFAVDNIVGIPDLDIEGVEVIPGAASALYGPNALNGLVLMNSKSPFLYQGLSANVKVGSMYASNRATAGSGLYDASIRYAKAFNNKFAVKLNLGYIKATDWQSTNYDNLNVGGSYNAETGIGSRTDYDGMNIYGDEPQANMVSVANSLIAAKLLQAAALPLIPNTNVNRTGFIESSLVNPNISSFKLNAALHYRLSEKVEAVLQTNYGIGTTLYTGNSKYSLKDFSLSQTKFELRGDNFSVRAYTTQENSGNSYAAGLTAVAMLNDIKPHATWFGTYVGGFAQARGAGLSEEAAHLTARNAANAGMPLPGSTGFQSLLDKYSTTLISDPSNPTKPGGGLFNDKSALYHGEATYNLKNQIKFVDLLVGANVRQYTLKSNGTLFADLQEGRTGTININEYGAFAQLGKSLLKDHLKLTVSGRYDKSQNFEGQFSPRASAVATFGDHTFRASYQTGFRIPTTQNQYIDLQVPSARLIGALPEFNTRYKLESGVNRATLVDFSTNPTKYITPDVIAKAQAYATAAVTPAIPTIQAAVTAAVQAQVTAAVTNAVNAAVAAGQLPAAAAQAAIQAQVTAQMGSTAIRNTIATNTQTEVVKQVTAVTTQVAPAFGLASLPKYKPKPFLPEKVKSIEIGYKSLIAKKLFVDASYYHSTYQNFIGQSVVLVPTAPAGTGLPIESGLGSANTRAAYQFPANTNQDVTVSGFSLGLDYAVSPGYAIAGNFSQNVMGSFTPTLELPYGNFNTPKNRFNVSFSKRITSGKNFGFSINYKNQDSFAWQTGWNVPTTTVVEPYTNTIVPSVSNIDVQASFKLSSMKSIIKIGGTNIGGTPYFQAYGSPSIGSTYYVSVTFDELLNK